MEREATTHETTMVSEALSGSPNNFVVSTACKPTQRRVATVGAEGGAELRRLDAEGGDEAMSRNTEDLARGVLGVS